MEHNQTQCDILNLEWSTLGRDREVATPICHALRKKGYKVIESDIFNYKHHLLQYRPRLVYVGDPRGAVINYQAAKFARKLKIPVITYTAEGNYTPEVFDEEGFYAHISDPNYFPELYLLWSIRTRQMVSKLNLPVDSNIKICGGVGFDRYKIYNFDSKRKWFNKYNIDGNKMIGYASWGFPRLHQPQSLKYWRQWYGDRNLRQLQHEASKINQILRKLIEQNLDVIFLLKEHPGVGDRTKSELYGLQDYSNVIYVWNEEPVADCISGCDIWMAFESTTCMEAWLLDKPTLLIDPSGINFPRNNVHKGSPMMTNYEDVQKVIDNFYSRGFIPGFVEKKESREQIIEDVMQWDDGKNHLRAAYLIDQFMRSLPEQAPTIGLWDRIGAYIQNFLYQSSPFFSKLPKFRTYAAARKRFNYDELKALQCKYGPYLDKFSQENPLTADDIAELEQINAL